MKILSEITGKWYDSPGECLLDEARNGGDAKKRDLEEAKKNAVELVLEAHEYVREADAAMLRAAIALVELHEMGGEMVKISEVPIQDHLTMLQTLMGIRKKVELLSHMNALKDMIHSFVEDMMKNGSEDEDSESESASEEDLSEEDEAEEFEDDELDLDDEDLTENFDVPTSVAHDESTTTDEADAANKNEREIIHIDFQTKTRITGGEDKTPSDPDSHDKK